MAHVKTGPTRGGFVRDVTFERLTADAGVALGSGVLVDAFYSAANPSCPSDWAPAAPPQMARRGARIGLRRRRLLVGRWVAKAAPRVQRPLVFSFFFLSLGALHVPRHRRHRGGPLVRRHPPQRPARSADRGRAVRGAVTRRSRRVRSDLRDAIRSEHGSSRRSNERSPYQTVPSYSVYDRPRRRRALFEEGGAILIDAIQSEHGSSRRDRSFVVPDCSILVHLFTPFGCTKHSHLRE